MLQLLLPQSSDLWLKAKESSVMRTRISSTELSSVLHLNRFKSKNRLWQEKTKKKKRESFYSLSAQRGIDLEPVAICEALEWIDPTRTVFTKILRPGIVFDPWSNMCCSPDALIPPYGLEVKVPNEVPKTLDQIQDKYVLQVFCSIHVTKFQGWYLFFLDYVDSTKSSLFFFQPNWDLWKNEILKESELFLESVRENRPPKRKSQNDRKFGESIVNRIKQGAKLVKSGDVITRKDSPNENLTD